MVRTQVYLTESEREALRMLSESSGKKKSELIRQAIDEFVARRGADRRIAVVR